MRLRASLPAANDNGRPWRGRLWRFVLPALAALIAAAIVALLQLN